MIRDDLLPGGTKVRALAPLMERWPEQEFVFGGPAQGYAQLALAHAAKLVGKRATFLIAKRKRRHPLTEAALEAGVNLIEVEHGRLNVVQKAAREYAALHGARFLPLGFDIPEFLEATKTAVRAAGIAAPSEVWVTAGTGCLARALQAAWPEAEHHAIQIGFDPDPGCAILHKAPERFEEPAELPPPFPSCANYDAKAWRFVKAGAKPGALFWNVGA